MTPPTPLRPARVWVVFTIMRDWHAFLHPVPLFAPSVQDVLEGPWYLLESAVSSALSGTGWFVCQDRACEVAALFLDEGMRGEQLMRHAEHARRQQGIRDADILRHREQRGLI